MTTRWFKGKELAFAVGINLATARLGSVLNDMVSPVLGVNYSVPLAVWVGSFSCGLSFLCSAGLAYVDLTRSPEGERPSQQEYIKMRNTAENEESAEEDDIFPRGSHDTISSPSSPFEVVKGNVRFPLAFWILQLIMVLMYATVLPFNTIHSAFLQTKWFKGDPIGAAQVMVCFHSSNLNQAIPDTISVILVPFVGNRLLLTPCFRWFC
jgi:hypothetical protein